MKKLEEHNYNGIDATIIADSVNEFGQRITTFIATFPRIILAEVNTHRALSRNSASSRAIPFEKMVKKVEKHPFIPIAWQKDHKGMQGTEYLTSNEGLEHAKNLWLHARDSAVKSSKLLRIMSGEIGYPSNNKSIQNVFSDFEPEENILLTKQLCNRLLEPFMYHTAIITATEYENFFALRCPQYVDPSGKIFRSKKDYIANSEWEGANEWSDLEWFGINKGQGEIHIMALAEAMWDARNESTPKKLKAGEWHIPFGDLFDENRLNELAQKLEDKQEIVHSIQLSDLMIKIATARCARVSYLNFEGKDDYEADIKLHDRLMSMKHSSPFEHCARVMSDKEFQTIFTASNSNYNGDIPKHDLGWSGNFRGFIQYRKMFRNENIE